MQRYEKGCRSLHYDNDNAYAEAQDQTHAQAHTHALAHA